MIKLYVSDHCPECEKLKRWNPEGGVEIINTNTTDGLADAMVDCVYPIPTAILDGQRFTGFYECRKLFMGE